MSAGRTRLIHGSHAGGGVPKAQDLLQTTDYALFFYVQP